MSRTDPQLKVRLSEELKAAVTEAAKNNHRSVNAEIVARLEESFNDYLVAGHRLSAEISPEEASDWKERVLAVEEAMKAFIGSRSLSSETSDSESESKPE